MTWICNSINLSWGVRVIISYLCNILDLIKELEMFSNWITRKEIIS